MPSNEEWQKFDALHREHPGKLMLWEEAPLPSVADRLRQIGVETVVFQTCAAQPEKGDYHTVMKSNAARLAAAIEKLR